MFYAALCIAAGRKVNLADHFPLAETCLRVWRVKAQA